MFIQTDWLAMGVYLAQMLFFYIIKKLKRHNLKPIIHIHYVDDITILAKTCLKLIF